MGKFRLRVAAAMAKGKKSENHVRQCWLPRRRQSEQGGSIKYFSQTRHLLFACLMSTTIGFLQVKAVFATHPKNLWVSLTAMFIYYLSFAAKKKILTTNNRESRYSQLLFDRFIAFWGALASISLVMVFLPPLPSWVFLPISAFLLTIVARLSLITQAACRVVGKISILFFMRIHGHAGGERQRCFA